MDDWSIDKFRDLVWLCVSRNVALHRTRDFAIRYDSQLGKIAFLADGEDGETEILHPKQLSDFVRHDYNDFRKNPDQLV